jgi:hypothetical protein
LKGRKLQIPDSLDWVAEGKVGAVKNQYYDGATCASNYALAATAGLESANAIFNDLTTIAVEDDPATLDVDESVPATFVTLSSQ